MAKNKTILNVGGYTTWGVIRTLRESENAARWSPWSAIAWMEEARDMISLDNPLYDEFDKAANKINALWKSYEKHHWYDARTFWARNGIAHPPQRIKTFDDSFSEYTPTNIDSLFKF